MKVRGAEVGIKPGVERSETSGSSISKTCEARDPADSGSIANVNRDDSTIAV